MLRLIWSATDAWHLQHGDHFCDLAGWVLLPTESHRDPTSMGPAKDELCSGAPAAALNGYGAVTGRRSSLTSRRMVLPTSADTFQVVPGLQSQPDSTLCAKVARQAQGRIRCNNRLTTHDLADPQRSDADIQRDPILGEPERFQETLKEDFTRVDGASFFIVSDSP